MTKKKPHKKMTPEELMRVFGVDEATAEAIASYGAPRCRIAVYDPKTYVGQVVPETSVHIERIHVDPDGTESVVWFCKCGDEFQWEISRFIQVSPVACHFSCEPQKSEDANALPD